MNTDDLIQQLARETTPVKRLPPPRRRFLRWLARGDSTLPPTVPPPAPAHDITGALVRCIADGWYNAPRGAPAKGQLCKVTAQQVKPLAEGHGALLMLTLEGVPGEYAAMGFVKVEPETEPAMPQFTRDLRRMSARVKARQDGAA